VGQFRCLLDAAALLVLDVDEPRRLRTGRTGERDVDVAAFAGAGRLRASVSESRVGMRRS
jgi:hypothetical protein